MSTVLQYAHGPDEGVPCRQLGRVLLAASTSVGVPLLIVPVSGFDSGATFLIGAVFAIPVAISACILLGFHIAGWVRLGLNLPALLAVYTVCTVPPAVATTAVVLTVYAVVRLAGETAFSSVLGPRAENTILSGMWVLCAVGVDLPLLCWLFRLPAQRAFGICLLMMLPFCVVFLLLVCLYPR